MGRRTSAERDKRERDDLLPVPRVKPGGDDGVRIRRAEPTDEGETAGWDGAHVFIPFCFTSWCLIQEMPWFLEIPVDKPFCSAYNKQRCGLAKPSSVSALSEAVRLKWPGSSAG